MRIVIAGGTGFLGTPLTAALVADRHAVVLLSRRSGVSTTDVKTIGWAPDGSSGPWATAIDGAGAVINLAGEPIADKRWTEKQKAHILDSRLDATRSLVAAIREASAPPPVLISGSGIGYYGDTGDEIVTEETPAGHDFLSRVCVAWEEAAMSASGPDTRVVCIRTGLVLARDGGALPKMLLPFRFGAGGPVGTGRQFWPWIHRQDWIDMVRFALSSPQVTGPLNASGPEPLPNADFARALGRAMRRPAFMPAPAFAVKAMLGEMADELLLTGQRALPAKAERTGFRFRYRTLDSALQDLFGGARADLKVRTTGSPT